MTVLRYNNVHTRLAVTLDSDDTTISFEAALQEGGVNVPTLAGGDVILLGIEDEIVALTAYTAGATTGTISRGYGDTLAAVHEAGTRAGNVITKDDVTEPDVSYNFRWTNAVSFPATTLTTAVGKSFTDALLDGSAVVGTDVTWVGASNRFETEVDGVFDICARAELDCDAATTGEAEIAVTITDAAAAAIPGVRFPTAHLRFGTGTDEAFGLLIPGLWLPADTRISATIIQNSGATMNWDYAEFMVRRRP